MFQYRKWIIPFLGYVLSTIVLQVATAHIESRGAHVPDLIMLGSSISYREAFESIVNSEVQNTYIITLLTADMIFPICYGTLLYMMASRAGRWSYAAIFACVFDLLENETAVAILGGGLNAVGLYAALSACKWAMLMTAFVAVAFSVVVRIRDSSVLSKE